MHLSVTTILLGEALLTGGRGLLLYWALWFVAVNLFVLGYEEPALRRQFGPAYDRYASTVGRWIPRRRPITDGPSQPSGRIDGSSARP
jgi:protein-S-isoprenylcysteine O-methyltransferase Ste14